MKEKLTFKQSKFIELYKGNATEAALEAGYSSKTAYSIGQELLKKPEIFHEIQLRNGKEMAEKIATRQERQEFWTQLMNDETMDTVCRLKASEILAKSEGDFVVQVKSDVVVSQAQEGFHRSLEERIELIKKLRQQGEGKNGTEVLQRQ